MTDENTTPATETPKPTKAKAPKVAKPKTQTKAPKPKKESTRAGKLTDAQADRFIAAYAKEHDLTDKQARDAILRRGVQRLATLARWSDKQS